MNCFRLTKPQLQISRLEKYAGSEACLICGSIFWNGSCDRMVLSAALNELLRRNDSLRLRLLEENEELQSVVPYSPVIFEELRFENEEAFQYYVRKYAKIPFRRGEAMFEANLAVLPDRYAVVVKVHHIIADAWSLALLAGQLADILEGKEPKTFSYEEFAERDAAWQESVQYRKDKAYFEEQVRACPEHLLLKSSAVTDFSAERETFLLSEKLTERIKKYLEETETTPFLFFLTALAVCLHRGAEKALPLYIGTPVINRVSDTDLHTAGMFVNNVPVLLRLDESRGFRENLETGVEDSVYQAFRHQRYNYMALREDLGEEAARLYDVLLSYHIESLENAGIAGMEQYPCEKQPETLQVHIEDRMASGRIAVHYDYQTAQLTKREVSRLHRSLEILMAAVLENAQMPLSGISLASAEDRERMENVNRTEAEGLGEETVYGLFEKNARAFPERVALRGSGWQLTYGEFLSEICFLDARIREAVPGTGNAVAILCTRSEEMYAAIYAVMRSGNIFVPISPDTPPERLQFLLADCGAKLVLAQSGFCGLFGEPPVWDVSRLIEEGRAKRMPENGELPVLANAGGSAYILYTSGSTGAPKGVRIGHRSLWNRIRWMQRKYPLDETGVILQKTPYTFDVSVWEIVWWGVAGASLAVSKPGEHFLPEKIVRDIIAYGVTHIHFVPSVFSLFVAYLEKYPEKAGRLPLRHLFLSGEAASADPVNRFQVLLQGSDVAVHNLYGPTECTIDVTFYDCGTVEQDPIPIGRPIDNTSVYVADRYHNPVPCGMTGELLIGGIGVGEGYVGRPDLTEEKFVRNPFGDGRLYCTGDRVYLNEDDRLVFCGRQDSQFKLNGQRIETAEIEAALASVPGVTAAAVVPEKEGEAVVICAYYSGVRMDSDELQAALRQKLPRYMVPKKWYYVKEMPLTASGKADRRALSGLEAELCAGRALPEPPRNEWEKQICEKYRELLKLEEVGRDTDFLAQGGSSLDVVTLLSEPEFRNISAAAFLADPTPAGLARQMAELADGYRSGLHCLVMPEKAEIAVLLFPFAGGNAASFSALVSALREKEERLAIYCADFPADDAACGSLAAEAAELPPEMGVVVYSHCVGAGPALRVLERLESEKPERKTAYVAAGLIPQPGKKKSPWRLVPDLVLRRLLIKAGAPKAYFESTRGQTFLKRFRKDTDYYFSLMGSKKVKIKSPTVLVFSEKDIFTGNTRRAAAAWSEYCTSLLKTVILKSRSHYFQTELASSVAEQLLERCAEMKRGVWEKE